MKLFFLRHTGIILGPLIFILFALFQPLNGTVEVNRMTGIVLWMAIWWMTECVHLAVTSLLPVVLIPLSQIAGIKEVAREYSDSIIFLFLGGFLISIAIEKWNLHHRIARSILRLTGSTVYGILAGVMISTFLISNWISNTATALMFFGVIMSLLKELETTLHQKDRSFLAIALMLGMAYASSIGGMVTPIGTPPNMYFFKVCAHLLGENCPVSFLGWIKNFLPLGMIILIGCYLILTILFLNKMSLKKIYLPFTKSHEHDKMSFEEKVISIVFLICVLLWLTREGTGNGIGGIIGWKKYLPHPDYLDDSVIAIAAALTLFIIPSKKDKGKNILVWEDVKQLKYEILLLFGGGFALAYGFEKSGLISYLIQQLVFVKYIHPLWVIFLISVIVVIVSEFASNIASVQLALPVIASMAIHFPKEYTMQLVYPCVLSASVGFMLPVATAPNTIAFGSGMVPVKSMMMAGFFLDILCIFTISLYSYFVL